MLEGKRLHSTQEYRCGSFAGAAQALFLNYHRRWAELRWAVTGTIYVRDGPAPAVTARPKRTQQASTAAAKLASLIS